MSNISQVLGASTTTKFAVVGNFVRLMNSTGIVEIVYYRNGAEVARTGDVLEGYAERVEGGFDAFTVQDKSAASNTVKLLYRIGGDVRYDRAAGNVSVSNSSTWQKIPVYESGFDFGASYKDNTLLGAGSVTTIVAPGSNVNGLILWSWQNEHSTAAYGGSGALIAKTSAPATIIDGDVLVVDSVEVAPGAVWYGGKLARTVKVPAGKGLYYFSPLAHATASIRSALYTLL